MRIRKCYGRTDGRSERWTDASRRGIKKKICKGDMIGETQGICTRIHNIYMNDEGCIGNIKVNG